MRCLKIRGEVYIYITIIIVVLNSPLQFVLSILFNPAQPFLVSPRMCQFNPGLQQRGILRANDIGICWA